MGLCQRNFSGKPMKNLLLVENRLAAVIKIILFSASFFIFWSGLALISSIYRPLSISWPAEQTAGNSVSLADSLYLEIIQSYFSLFTISALVVILLAGLLGYFWSKQASNSLFPFHEDQNPFFVLLGRVFNTTSNKILDLSSPDAVKNLNESGSPIYGPAKILIQDGAVGLISQGMVDFRAVISDGVTPNKINSGERLVIVLPFIQNNFVVKLIAPKLNELPTSIQLRYKLQLNDLSGRITPSGIQFLSYFGSNNWKELLESVIQLEFENLAMLERKPVLEITSIKQQEFSDESENELSHSQTHPLYRFTKPLIRLKISRNRKRGQYPLVTSDNETILELESSQASIEKLQPLMNEFIKILNRTTIQLFGFNMIKIIDYEIG
jgi:hypothetical protein